MHLAQDVNITPGHALCIIERVVVLIWRQTPTRAGLDGARALFHLVHTRRPTEKWGFLTLFEPAATISNVPDDVEPIRRPNIRATARCVRRSAASRACRRRRAPR